MAKLRIDVWSDIACPWCYVGKRRLEAALARFPHRDRVDIVWRAFELDPAAPRTVTDGLSYAERLSRKYRTGVLEAEERLHRLTDVAAGDGLSLRFDRIRPGNTFDAHRLLHLALDHGVQDAVKERFLHAYLTEGEAIGDPEVLSRLAREAGLGADDTARVLTTEAYAHAVRYDEEEASALGIHGVPYFVIGGHHAVSGAQTAEVLLGALDLAWAEVEAADRPSPVQDAACGPEGCP